MDPRVGQSVFSVHVQDAHPQELSVWSQEQSACEGYATYKELVGSFRAKMVAAKGNGTEMPENIKDISEEGAKGLLDELSKQR